MADKHGVTEVKPGKYMARIYIGLDPTTRQQVYRAKVFTAKNMTAAIRERNRIASQFTDAHQVERDRQATVGGLVDLWVKHRSTKDSPATIYRRASIVAAIKRDLGHHRLEDLKPLQLDQWYDTLRAENIAQGAKPKYRTEATIHHYHRVLASILKQGWNWELTDRLPAARATAPKKRRHARPTVPPPATVRLLLDAAPPNLAVAAHVLAATGLRRGELAALRWTDVDLEAGMISVTKALAAPTKASMVVKAPKNDESIRRVTIDAGTVAILDRYLRTSIRQFPDLALDGYLFPDIHSGDPTGRTPRQPDWISRGWRRLCDAKGAKVRLHDLRHFSVTTLLAAGLPVNAVAERHGHSNASTTSDIYGHSVAGQDAGAAEIMRLALGPATEGRATGRAVGHSYSPDDDRRGAEG